MYLEFFVLLVASVFLDANSESEIRFFITFLRSSIVFKILLPREELNIRENLEIYLIMFSNSFLSCSLITSVFFKLIPNLKTFFFYCF